MTMARYQFTVTDDAGNVVPGAHVEVRRETSGAPLQALKSDRDGAVAMSNPFDADADGFAYFHSAPGSYKIRAYLGSFERIWRYVDIGVTYDAPEERAFATLAVAESAVISDEVVIVRTLGRVTPGDNGGASYIRIAASTAAAWRFQSADGQWWALNSRTVTPEIFGIFNGGGAAANTTGFQSLASYLNLSAPISVTINNTPNADYKIWPVGVAAPNLMQLTGLNGLVWNWNGSRISTDRPMTDGQVGVIALSHCTNITINSPRYVETAWSVLSSTTGGGFFFIGEASAPWSSNILFTNASQDGGVQFLVVGGAGDLSGGYAQNISVINADLQNVFYGFSFQAAGDNFFARGITGNNTGRLYFPWNVSNHDVELIGNAGAGNDQVLVKVYGLPQADEDRRRTSNIRVRYKDTGRVNAAGASMSHVSFQQSAAEVTVTGAANNGSGKVRLTVNSTADMTTGKIWFFRSIGGTTEANGKFPVTVINATTVDLATVNFVNAYTSGGYARVPATISDVSINLEVADTTGNGADCCFSTSKYNSGGSVDTTVSGYTFENFELSGTIKDHNDGTSAVELLAGVVSVGTWTGETIRNVAIRNLTISGTSGLVYAWAPTGGGVLLENITLDSGITWSLSGTLSAFQVENVTGLTDTMPAFTLGGTISGGGNQINNVVIGTSTPLAGTFTGITATAGIAVTGGNGTTNNQNAESSINIANNHAGTSAGATVQANNGSAVVKFGMRGLNQTAYGPLAANAGHIYSPRPFVVMADGFQVAFSSGSAAETARFTPNKGLSIGTTTDRGAGTINMTGGLFLGSFTVASAPTGTAAGNTAYFSNLRVFNGAGTQEGAGVGTGGMGNYNGTAWKIAGTNITIAA